MSQPPFLRIGGTGGDYFTFNPDQKVATACRTGACGTSTASNILGPSYFDGFSRFQNATMIIQAPLDNPINNSNTVAFVWQAWSKLGAGKRVASIALGNEVEFIYKGGAAAYNDAALSLQASIFKNLSLSGDATQIFQARNTASGSVVNGGAYTVKDILSAGINKNGLIKITAEHWYQIMDTPAWTDANMQDLMLNHTAITTLFQKYLPSLQASNDANIPYLITEDAAVLGGAPIEFEEALDTRSGIANLAGAPTSKRVFWNPDNSGGTASPGPQVRAPFPATMFVADSIGSTGQSAVSEVDLGHPFVSAYSMFDNAPGSPQRVALVNMRIYNATNGNDRGKVTFNLSIGNAAKSVTIRRLHANRGIAAMGFDFGGPSNNVSWAGEQWSHSVDLEKGHFTTGAIEETIKAVTNGAVSLVLPDSEAALLIVS